MHELFSQMYPKKFMTPLQVITSMKEKKIIYDSQVRCDGIKGCFTGVKLILEMDDEEVEEFNNINVFKANSSEQKLIKSLQDEINMLKKQLEQKPVKKQLKVDDIVVLYNSPKKIYPSISEVEEIVYNKIYPSSQSSLIQDDRHYEGVDSDSDNDINDFDDDDNDDDDDDNDESKYILDIGGDYEDPILQSFK